MNYFRGERIERLNREIVRWNGTKFSPRMVGPAVPGLRADCVTFAIGVLVNVGALRQPEWTQHVAYANGPGVLAQILERMSLFDNLETLAPATPDELIPGDLLLISEERSSHHFAIYGGGNVVWHCLARYGVCEGSVHDSTIWGHLWCVFRAQDRKETNE